MLLIQVFGQDPTDLQPSSDIQSKASVVIAAVLEKHRNGSVPTQPDRAKAYAKMMEGQRYVWSLTNNRGGSGDVQGLINKARSAFIAAFELDPSLSEAVTALSELAISGPIGDLDEAIKLSEIAVSVDKNNFGAHKILARLYTYKSGFSTGETNTIFVAKSIDEWNVLTRLDPRYAEAWAFLSEFYRRGAKSEQNIEALQKWIASASPIETGFYQRMMGGREDLTVENASLKLADAYMDAGRFKDAIEVLSLVIADKPNNTIALTMLTEAIQRGSASDSTAAVQALQQAVFANPGNVAVVSALAQVTARNSGLEPAVKVFEAAIAKALASTDPNIPDLYLSLGDLLDEKGQYDRAMTAYDKALKEKNATNGNPVSSDDAIFTRAAFDRMIRAAKRAGKTEELRKIIEKARQALGPDDNYPDRQLITLDRYNGRREEALLTVRKLLAKSPRDPGLVRLEASILAEMGRIDEAVDGYKKRTTASQTSPPLTSDRSGGGSTSVSVEIPRQDEFSDLLFISQLYSHAGRNKEAVETAEKALAAARSRDRRQLAKLSIATAQQMNRNFAEAEATLRDILKETPGNPIALNNLGYFLLERGERFEEALSLINKAVEIDPTNPSYLDSLGWAFFKLGKTSEAEKPLLEALRLDPESSTINEHLGDIYTKLGRPELARSYWQRALELASEPGDIERLKGKVK